MCLLPFQSGPSLAVINVYCPRADPTDPPARQEFKLRFYKLLEMRACNLVAAGHRVVVVGDVNTSHTRMDHCDPGEVGMGTCRWGCERLPKSSVSVPVSVTCVISLVFPLIVHTFCDIDSINHLKK